MDWFLLQPQSIIWLAPLLLNAAILGYLLTVRGKSRAAWWLCLTVGCWALYCLHLFLGATLRSGLEPGLPDRMQAVGLWLVPITVSALAGTQFYYTLLDSPFERERKVVLATSVAGVAALAGYAVYLFFLQDTMPFQEAFARADLLVIAFVMSLLILGIIVLMRKGREAESAAGAATATPFYFLAGLNSLFILSLISLLASLFRPEQLPHGAAFLVFQFVFIAFVYGVLVVYTNYAAEPTTVQVKVTGLAFATVLVIFSAVAALVFPAEGLDRAALHERVLPLFYLMLGASVFILLGFPLFFRAGLIAPLRRLLAGVRRVNDGNLDTEVPVGTRDEIGQLTHNFNRMTGSLQQYASEMETLVNERTAELERSLEELRQAQDQLVQQEKMASLGALTAGIAHEIKNPLNFINNFAALSGELVDELREDVLAYAEADGKKNGELEALMRDLKTNASKIEEHGRRADGIVKSMLLHSRGTPGERQEVNLNTLVEEYVSLAYHGMRAQHAGFNVAIARDYGEYVKTVEVVPQELGRVFINLLSNAFDAVHEQAARLDGHYAPAVSVRTRALGDNVEIRVRDNGPGIPAGTREKIFEPFFTTKPTGEGTGLGLSMSYDIVTQGHGGEMRVESTEGEGAAFVVMLPVEGASARTAHAAASTENTEEKP